MRSGVGNICVGSRFDTAFFFLDFFLLDTCVDVDEELDCGRPAGL
jgi:hypothetical protein